MLMKHTIFYSMSDNCFIPFFFSFDKRLECTDLGRFCLKILAPIQSAVLTRRINHSYMRFCSIRCALLAHYNESGAFFSGFDARFSTWRSPDKSLGWGNRNL